MCQFSIKYIQNEIEFLDIHAVVIGTVCSYELSIGHYVAYAKLVEVNNFI